MEQIAEGGFLLLSEATRPWTCMLWGLDARSWQFTDEREYGLWISRARWHRLLAAAGLVMVACNKCVRCPCQWHSNPPVKQQMLVHSKRQPACGGHIQHSLSFIKETLCAPWC